MERGGTDRALWRDQVVQDVMQQATEAEALLRTARARFTSAESASAAWRVRAREDLDYLAGQQWPQEIVTLRARDGRPCLTINQLPQFVRQVVNEERQNRPQVTIAPVDSVADPQTATVLEGLVRQTQNSSYADLAYDTAMDAMAACGLGYLRLNTRYSDPWSFDQEPTIERILNPLTVYLDPTSTDPTAADAQWAFIVMTRSKDEYTATYGRLPAEASSWEREGDAWITPDTVRVAEYYWKELVPLTLALLEDGSALPADAVPEGVAVVQTRTTHVPIVHWACLNGHQVLEQHLWQGSSIPLVKVTGDERLLSTGEVDYSGVVRSARDPQYQYNLMASAQAEAIALAPKAPWVLGEGQQEGYEEYWDTANTRNWPYLPYRPVSLGGVPLPPPQRNTAEPAVQAITQALLIASQNLHSTTGIYPPALGQAGGPQEAAATVGMRQQQSSVGNFHYLDNLRRSVRRVGQILVELYGRLYDRPQVVRILGADKAQQSVLLNTPSTDPQTGQPRLYDLRVGRYDVVVNAGPGYATQRQEALSVLTQMTVAMPQTMQFAADLLVSQLDIPQAQALSERLQKLLPTALQTDESGQPTQAAQLQQLTQIAQQQAQQMQGMQQIIGQLQTQLEDISNENKLLTIALQTKTEEQRLKAQENAIQAQQVEYNHQEELIKLQIDQNKVMMSANNAGNGTASD